MGLKTHFSRALILLTILSFLIISCNNKHFISDPLYREKVEKQFSKQKILAKNRQKELFDVFDKITSLEESEALKFLYAYMPLSDLAEYNSDFYLKNIRITFKAKETFSWCKIIPEEIFRHFVLPIRVNNERLDSSRTVFFEELESRVKNLSMKEAALEVNHWCHEKVIYKSTDARTSSPLNTVKTAYGRCGEESTFAVAALRSVGIPARQCYTPRWAHSDDNHAWVEVWVDGKWHFIGACEPEPDLDLAWFTEPSKRAMLVNTNVFGDYNGQEEVLFKNDYYTKINLLANYTETKTIYVKAKDVENKFIDSAEIEFCLYNYAEFYPLSTRYTDRKGICSFTTGMGDLLIWGNYKGKFGFQKLAVSNTDTLILVLDKTSDINTIVNFDLIPPKEKDLTQKISEKARFENDKRLKNEDKIRNKYISTFIDSTRCAEIAKNTKLNKDSVINILIKSCGNWNTISKFLEANSAFSKWKLLLLYSLSEKDLHDIVLETLFDHLENSFTNYSELTLSNKTEFVSYVLCPRIGSEGTSPFKSFLQKKFGTEFISKVKKDINFLINWIRDSITINEVANYYNVPISPIGVGSLLVSDKKSRDIFFVAMCRSAGIPARIENSTKQAQYLLNNVWENAVFDICKTEVFDKGIIVLENMSTTKDFVPLYSIHYSIAYFKDGKYKTLDYEEDPLLLKFPCKLEVNIGKYLLITGSRLKDGSVLSSLSFFEVKTKQTKIVPIKMRVANNEIKKYGKIALEHKVKIDNNELPISSIKNSKGLVLVWVDPEKEPTKHLFKEIMNLKNKFDKWSGNILFLTKDEIGLSFTNSSKYSNLPKQSRLGIDKKLSLLKSIEIETNIDLSSQMPAIVIVNSNSDIVFTSSGYAIGIGEQMIQILNTN